MIDNDKALAILEATDRRRAERRRFLTLATSGAATIGGLSLLSACGKDKPKGDATPTPTPTPTPTATSTSGQADIDILNFALNLEYLEAQFYLYAVYGTGLPGAQTSGTGTLGTVTGGRKVTFTDPVVAQYAREIAQDEGAHVNYLRTALGGAAVAMPNINIAGGAGSPFAAAAAGTTAGGSTFDPYASDENFLLAAFLFEDVGVSAYKGAAPLITNTTYLSAAAGILAAESYHAGLIRTALYAKGLATPTLRADAGKISDARDGLDGASDDDQGITGDATTSNIVPTDGNGIVYSRNTNQVLHIVYLNATAATASGGFFPNGLAGNITTAAANP